MCLPQGPAPRETVAALHACEIEDSNAHESWKLLLQDHTGLLQAKTIHLLDCCCKEHDIAAAAAHAAGCAAERDRK
jgi:hypothetical protein